MTKIRTEWLIRSMPFRRIPPNSEIQMVMGWETTLTKMQTAMERLI